MAKEKKTNGTTEDWVEKLLVGELKEDIQDPTPSIQTFISNKVEEMKPKTEDQTKKIITISELEDEGYTFYSNLDEFLADSPVLDKRYIGVNFIKTNDEKGNSNISVSSIVVYEVEKSENNENSQLSFENFRNQLSNVENFDNVIFSSQNTKNITLDANIELIQSLTKKAIERDPELNFIVFQNKKNAAKDAKNIAADELSGDTHIDLEEDKENNGAPRINRKNKIK